MDSSLMRTVLFRSQSLNSACNSLAPKVIKYLVPADYYRGDPDIRIAERKEKLVQAAEMRQAYWQRKEGKDQGQTLT